MEGKTVTSTKYTTFQNFCEPLKKSKNKDLHGHITKVVSHLVLHEHASNALDKFEETSYLLKHPELQDEFLKTRVVKDYAKPFDKALAEQT